MEIVCLDLEGVLILPFREKCGILLISVVILDKMNRIIMAGVVKMYNEEYKRWMAADLEDADLKPELSKIEGNDEEIKYRFPLISDNYTFQPQFTGNIPFSHYQFRYSVPGFFTL